MLRNLEKGDKVTIELMLGSGQTQYIGKVEKIGRKYIYVNVLRIEIKINKKVKNLRTPCPMKFNRFTFRGVGKDTSYDLMGCMYGEHEVFK
jgi:hypothetical protein